MTDRRDHRPTTRRATPGDQPAIRRMVRGAHLDPTGLHWSHFVVAERDGEIVGVGQIRPFRRGPELGSLVVRDDLRGQGIGGLLIRALLDGQSGVVYLECGRQMVPYYERFGFEEIRWQDAPMPLRLKAGLGNLVFGGRIAMMRVER